MNTSTRFALAFFLALFSLLLSSKAISQNTYKSDTLVQGRQSLIEKYKDYLVPENIVFQTADGSARHYRINNTTVVTTINAIASGNVRRTTSGYLKTSGRLRIQNESSTGCNYGYRAWAKYDVTSIPTGSTISDVDQSVYCVSRNQSTFDWVEYDIFRVSNEPVAASGSVLWSDISGGAQYENNEAILCDVLCSDPPDWETTDLNDPAYSTTADADLQASLSLGWFAIGYMVDCNEDNPTYSAEFRGVGESNPPHFVIEYTLPVCTLNIASLNPSTGVNITVSPNDNNGRGNGVTQFARYYYHSTNVTLTAPATVGGQHFQKWQRNGVDYSTNRSTSVNMDDDYSLTVVYPGVGSVEQVSIFIPDQYYLAQNYPNPFNPISTIEFSLPKESRVRLTVYDVLGRELEKLVDEELHTGVFRTTWGGTNSASGLYYYRLIAVPLDGGQPYVQTRKMVLAK